MDSAEPLEVMDPIRKRMNNGYGQLRIYADHVEIDRKKGVNSFTWAQVKGFVMHNQMGSPFKVGIDLDIDKDQMSRQERMAVKAGGEPVVIVAGTYTKDIVGLAEKLSQYHQAWQTANS